MAGVAAGTRCGILLDMKFLHAADLHIDSPLRGLQAYEGAPVEQVRLASRRALENLVEIALNQAVDFVLLAGDLFDQDWKDFNTALFVVGQLQKLDQAGIPVVAIRGNHDSVADMTHNVPWPRQHFKLLDHQAPELVRLDDLGVAIHGMSFSTRHVAENLAQRYPVPLPGMFNIGLLHTSATGSASATQHAVYAPCTVAELVAKGYDYWALGHIHQYEILHNTDCHVVYAGNIQGRHIRECGEKGCVLVTVEGRQITDLQFVTTDVLRWEHLVIDASGAVTTDDLQQLARSKISQAATRAAGRLLGVRLEFRGNCAAHKELSQDVPRKNAELELRALATELSDGAWVEKIVWNTRPAWDRESLSQGQDWLGELLRHNDLLRSEPQKLMELRSLLNSLIAKVELDLQGTTEAGVPFQGEIDFQDQANLQRWLQSAEDLLLSRLV